MLICLYTVRNKIYGANWRPKFNSLQRAFSNHNVRRVTIMLHLRLYWKQCQSAQQHAADRSVKPCKRWQGDSAASEHEWLWGEGFNLVDCIFKGEKVCVVNFSCTVLTIVLIIQCLITEVCETSPPAVAEFTLCILWKHWNIWFAVLGLPQTCERSITLD